MEAQQQPIFPGTVFLLVNALPPWGGLVYLVFVDMSNFCLFLGPKDEGRREAVDKLPVFTRKVTLIA